MKIKYNNYSVFKNTEIEESLASWIRYNLSSGGIEDRIEKIEKLLTVIADDFLTRNPDKLDEVVRAVDCSGLGHKLVTE